MRSPTTISMVRHGHIINRRSVFHGRLPGFPLSEEGVAQVQSAARALLDRPVAVIFSSPMLRARQTAHILREARPERPPVREEPRLNEVYTPFDGRPKAELAARDWDLYTGVASDYEQPQTILNRVLAFLHRVRRLYTGQYVVGVTHADLLAFLWLWVLQQPVTVDNRRRLRDFGLADHYPAEASISTFRFETLDADERPNYTYLRPYE